jgi:oligoribonuclease
VEVLSDDPKHLCFVDLETAGTDEHSDPIIELAMILTDLEGEQIDSYKAACLPAGYDAMFVEGRMASVVYEMHKANGLLGKLHSGDYLDTQTVESQVITILSSYAKPHDFVLAGSGVAHFDRRFIAAQMPDLNRWFRYYSIDVGVMRRIIGLAGRDDLVPPLNEAKNHRAMDDIRLHLAEFRTYLALLRAIPRKD